MSVEAVFAPWVRRWSLLADGPSITTATSDLLPVRRGDQAAMLKLARCEEERRGAALMQWWHGDGAASVLAAEGPALLLERAEGTGSLSTMATGGADDAAARILCDVAERLHRPRGEPPGGLVPLHVWFDALTSRSWREARMAAAADLASALLSDSDDIRPLHGDLHHENVLDFGDRGWLAIDPKGLLGERCFDFANLLRNPFGSLPLSPRRLARQASVIADAATLERRRLLLWTAAFSGLSAAWALEDGADPAHDLAMLDLARAELSL